MNAFTFVLYLHRMYEKDKAGVCGTRKSFKHSQSLVFNACSGFFFHKGFCKKSVVRIYKDKNTFFSFLPLSTVVASCPGDKKVM